MQLYVRRDGEEQPYWPFGPFQIRLPLVHYRWESAEMVQGLIMFVSSLGMIPLIEQYLGVPYSVALVFVVVCGLGYLLPALLGVPLVPGWITPAIPVVTLFLEEFDPGPEAIQALVALQLTVAFIFLWFALTGWGTALVQRVPASLKGGLLMGAGMAALMIEIRSGGRLAHTPISLIVGGILSTYLLFSESFKASVRRHAIARLVATYGMVPAMIVSMLVGWSVAEYPLPVVQYWITRPAFAESWNYLPFSLGMPSFDLFLLAAPTAVVAYIIAFGDIIVGSTLMRRVDGLRTDERITIDLARVHLVTGIRNLLHAFFAPYPGLAGPIWIAATATITERYTFGRDAMESIYSGSGTFWIAGLIALFILPLVTLFQPVLPIALSLTLLVAGYLCITIGIEQVHTPTQRGVAGVVGVVLAMYGAAHALAIGLLLHIIIERRNLFGEDGPSQ